jgi:hypothetical protein
MKNHSKKIKCGETGGHLGHPPSLWLFGCKSDDFMAGLIKKK